MTVKRMFFILFLCVSFPIFASPPEYTITGEYQIIGGLDGESVYISHSTLEIYNQGRTISYKYSHVETSRETSIFIFKPENTVFTVTFFVSGNIDTYFLELRNITTDRVILLKKST